MDDIIYTEIISGLDSLVNLDLEYITKRNSVKITKVDHAANKVYALRGEEPMSIVFDRFKSVSAQLVKGGLVDVNDALGAGGNDRSAIEAIIAHLPNVGYYNGNTKYNKSPQKKIAWFREAIHELGEMLDTSDRQLIPINPTINIGCSLPKPFLLLAGISGTGKTRFVREQAAASKRKVDNYCLIPVRPDWHEPSDLLGYVSRIGANGARNYVVTDLLKFVVRAWQDAAMLATSSAAVLSCKSAQEMTPFWLCLDEMNLAPVEQYFADYLAVVETRKWSDEHYTCDPLLKAATLDQLDEAGRVVLRKELQLDDAQFDGLWAYFVKVGIPLPPNLIVAGTVNMDETTHGFSRKVIDRAFTIDFGVFYPNDFDEFFDEDKITRPKTLGFPQLSKATKSELAKVVADAGGVKSIAFLAAINAVLRGTPFELAYRALNELLLAVVCFNPKDDAELQAVWDDFLMSKVLPRIDGDLEKLKALNVPDAEKSSQKNESLLTQLEAAIATQFANKAEKRPDLLREKIDGGVCAVAWRAEEKLNWMQTRLGANGFTTFWP